MKKRINKAKTDDAFLNQVSFIVFVIRFNYQLVEKKWPQIEKAFYRFNIKKLSRMDPENLDVFMKAPGMIKNKWKMSSVIVNAKKCAEIQAKHGSVLQWIEQSKRDFKESPILAPELRDIFRTFRGIGPMTSTWLESLYMSPKPYVEYEV